MKSSPKAEEPGGRRIRGERNCPRRSMFKEWQSLSGEADNREKRWRQRITKKEKRATPARQPP